MFQKGRETSGKYSTVGIAIQGHCWLLQTLSGSFLGLTCKKMKNDANMKGIVISVIRTNN